MANAIIKAHADASPSAASIWIACPASVTKARGRVRKSTPYTREGSAAHEVAERLLRMRVLSNRVAPKLKTLVIDNELVKVSQEMLDAVESYVRFALSRYYASDNFIIETQVSVPTSGENLWGTLDAGAYVKSLRLASVMDFKYGAGVAVDPNSPQLKIYALGLLGALADEDPHEIELVIVQPRASGATVKTHIMTVSELLDWKIEVLDPATHRLFTGDLTETPGEHCRWCVRAGECSALANLANENAKVAFGEVPPDPPAMTDADIGRVLDHAEMILAWVNKVRAEASARLDVGRQVPGWKLVPKRAVTKWTDEDGAMDVLIEAGVPPEAILRIQTLTEVRKALKRERISEDILEPFTEKTSSGTTLVSQNDTRPALDMSAEFDYIPTIEYE